MSGFQELEGETALIVERGVYKQVPLFERAGALFAKAKGGFVRLSKDGSTSVSTVRMQELIYDGDLFADPFGRLCCRDGERRKPLQISAETLTIEDKT